MVREGYKQTEVGIIPVDWEVVTVDDVADVKRGAGSQYIEYANSSNGVRFIRITDFYGSDAVYVKKTDNLKRFLIEERDILFAGTGNTAGISFTPPESWVGLPFSYNAPRIRVKKKIYKKFIAHALKSQYVRLQQEEHFVGAAQPFLDTKAISGLTISLPPTQAEQRAIATALADTDALLAALDALIGKKEAFKRGMMEGLLAGERRLEGFTGVWEEKLIADFCITFSGGTPSTNNPAYYNGEINWITSSDLNKGQIHSVKNRISMAGLENSASKMVKSDSLLVALYGATAGVSAITKIEGAINQAILCLESEESTVFLYYWFQLKKEYILETFTQGGQPNLSGDIIKKLELSLPPLPEQRAIAKVLSDLDAELAALRARRAKLGLVKGGMMEVLLGGEVRLV